MLGDVVGINPLVVAISGSSSNGSHTLPSPLASPSLVVKAVDPEERISPNERADDVVFVLQEVPPVALVH